MFQKLDCEGERCPLLLFLRDSAEWVSHSHENGNGFNFRNALLSIFLEYQTMDKVLNLAIPKIFVVLIVCNVCLFFICSLLDTCE
jgi:hypothetical protein